eukprot:1136444-Rhodomonas_salina.1
MSGLTREYRRHFCLRAFHLAYSGEVICLCNSLGNAIGVPQLPCQCCRIPVRVVASGVLPPRC